MTFSAVALSMPTFATIFSMSSCMVTVVPRPRQRAVLPPESPLAHTREGNRTQRSSQRLRRPARSFCRRAIGLARGITRASCALIDR